jgi:uncharacterized membrane protein
MVGSPFAWILCLGIRLIPHIPNVEPLLATQMLFSRRHHAHTNFWFACSNIFFFDLLTAHLGPWTIITALSYGLLGIAATYYFKRTDANYFLFAAIGTIAYDLATCIFSGPLLFGQPLCQTLIAQIPFSCIHLCGNFLFALVLHSALEIKIKNIITKRV